MAETKQYTLDDLLAIMRTLRDPDKGCPWDLKQSYDSIVPHTLEEVYELVDAIDNKNFDEIRDELGDLLFQIVFYAQLAGEDKKFCFADIVQSICQKLIHRHPHVFTAEGREHKSWEAIKQEERQLKMQNDHASVPLASQLDGICAALPALASAQKVQRRAAVVGFDWANLEGVLDKLNEEITELREAVAGGKRAHIEEEMGDVLFSCVNLSRTLQLHAENTLRLATGKFVKRFRKMEQLISEKDKNIQELTLSEMDFYWQSIKDKQE